MCMTVCHDEWHIRPVGNMNLLWDFEGLKLGSIDHIKIVDVKVSWNIHAHMFSVLHSAKEQNQSADSWQHKAADGSSSLFLLLTGCSCIHLSIGSARTVWMLSWVAPPPLLSSTTFPEILGFQAEKCMTEPWQLNVTTLSRHQAKKRKET